MTLRIWTDQSLALQFVDEAQVDQIEQPVMDPRLEVEILVRHVFLAGHARNRDRFQIHFFVQQGFPLFLQHSDSLSVF